MAPDWQTQFTEAAIDKVDAFIADHPEISRDGVPQPGQGATNRVIFARRGGRRGDSRGDSRLVFKVFCTPERKARETFGLRHWAGTGLVPRLLYDVDDRMVATSYIPGDSLHESWQPEGGAAWHAACGATGRAIAKLARVPLSSSDRISFEARFYDGLGPLEAYLSRILDLGHRITSRDPDFRDHGHRAAGVHRQERRADVLVGTGLDQIDVVALVIDAQLGEAEPRLHRAAA